MHVLLTMAELVFATALDDIGQCFAYIQQNKIGFKGRLTYNHGVMYAQAQWAVYACHHASAAACVLNLHQVFLLAFLTDLA